MGKYLVQCMNDKAKILRWGTLRVIYCLIYLAFLRSRPIERTKQHVLYDMDNEYNIGGMYGRNEWSDNETTSVYAKERRIV